MLSLTLGYSHSSPLGSHVKGEGDWILLHSDSCGHTSTPPGGTFTLGLSTLVAIISQIKGTLADSAVAKCNFDWTKHPSLHTLNRVRQHTIQTCGNLPNMFPSLTTYPGAGDAPRRSSARNLMVLDPVNT